MPSSWEVQVRGRRKHRVRETISEFTSERDEREFTFSTTPKVTKILLSTHNNAIISSDQPLSKILPHPLSFSYSVKDLGVTVASNLKFSRQCNESVKKTNRMTGWINKKFSFKNKDVVLPCI